MWSVFDLLSVVSYQSMNPASIAIAAFCTPDALCSWLRIRQGPAGAPSWFVSVMRNVIAGLFNIRMYLDDTISSAGFRWRSSTR